MNGNDFMSWVLRSPLHGVFSKGMMLITVTGYKTGRQFTIPVGFYEEGGYLWILTSRNRTWWKNLRGGVEVGLLMKRKPVRGFADTELDEKSVETQMVEYFRRIPQAMKPMNVRVKNGIPNAEDIARIARERLFVRIKLAGQAP